MNVSYHDKYEWSDHFAHPSEAGCERVFYVQREGFCQELRVFHRDSDGRFRSYDKMARALLLRFKLDGQVPVNQGSGLDGQEAFIADISRCLRALRRQPGGHLDIDFRRSDLSDIVGLVRSSLRRA